MQGAGASWPLLKSPTMAKNIIEIADSQKEVRQAVIEQLKRFNLKTLHGRVNFKHRSQYLPPGQVEDPKLVFYRWWPRVEMDNPVVVINLISDMWQQREFPLKHIATEDLISILKEFQNQQK